MPATKMVVFCSPPGTETQFVLRPYEVSGPKLTLASPTHPVVNVYCATRGFDVPVTEPLTLGVVIAPPQAVMSAAIADRTKRLNVFNRNESFIFSTQV